MSQEERSAAVSILVNSVAVIWLALRLNGLWQSGAFDGPDALQIWARTVLWVIPVAIAGFIGMTIIVAIVHGIVTRDTDTRSDERDKAYQMRGMAATMVVASIGMVGAIIALALGYSGVFAMTAIYFSTAGGSIVGDVTRIMSYRVWG